MSFQGGVRYAASGRTVRFILGGNARYWSRNGTYDEANTRPSPPPPDFDRAYDGISRVEYDFGDAETGFSIDPTHDFLVSHTYDNWGTYFVQQHVFNEEDEEQVVNVVITLKAPVIKGGPRGKKLRFE